MSTTNTAGNQKSLEALFTEYQDSTLLSKLEDYALWTIPSVFPKDTTAAAQRNANIEYDFQSKGALIVNRLATKLARTLFPANTSFFKLELTDAVKDMFEKQQVDDIVEFENAACSRIFHKASYAQIVQALRLLIITGECLLHRFNGALRVYSLRNYVLKRNNVGEPLDMVIREFKFYEELSQDIQSMIGQKPTDTPLELYTRVAKQPNGSWKVTQEINGVDIGTDVEYRDKLCPYIPVTWNFVNGDNYGRGYVEDYAADLCKLSRMSASLSDYEFEALKLIHLVDPSFIFDVDAAEQAVSGAYIQGQPNAVQPYEAGDYKKIMEIRSDLAQVEQRLDIAFMYMGNNRDGERVTAYEVRQNAEEAEQVLGGVYSQLSQNMHLPLAYLLLNEENPTVIHEFDRGNLELEIVTGLQALSRSSENQNLVIAASEINSVIPVFTQLGLPEVYNIGNIADLILQANGINLKSLKYTEAEIRERAEAAKAANEQQQMQAQAAMGQPQGMGQLAGQESAVDALQNSRMM